MKRIIFKLNFYDMIPIMRKNLEGISVPIYFPKYWLEGGKNQHFMRRG
jgi:hypothetical protein